MHKKSKLDTEKEYHRVKATILEAKGRAKITGPPRGGKAGFQIRWADLSFRNHEGVKT